jgi:hypothetical protein
MVYFEIGKVRRFSIKVISGFGELSGRYRDHRPARHHGADSRRKP